MTEPVAAEPVTTASVTAEPVTAEPAVPIPVPGAPSSRPSSAYLALGYLCFSTTLFILAVFHAGLVSFNFIVAVFPTAIFFGGVAQFIAGIWAYSQRNFFAAVTFTSFAAFWLSYSLYTWLFLPQLVANFGNSVTAATGSFTLAWGLVALFTTVAARRVNRAVFGLLSLTTLMFLFITIGQYAVAPPVDLVGGVFALAAAVLGLYAGAAYLINGSYGRVVLPLGEPRS
ncbi:acetate uptake transporter [Amycolatopsis lurida]